MDDFLIIGKTQSECLQGLLALIKLLHSLGFNISWKKFVSPSPRDTFLGVKLDSSTMLIRLPVDKLNCLKTLIASFSVKVLHPSAKCHVVRGGRTFLCRVIDCVNKLKYQSDRCRLTSQFRADILWWNL